MGLCIKVRTKDWDEGGRARWSYSGFHRFRTYLCEAAGLGNLAEYEGFGGKKKWPSFAREPLVPLLRHSDCDGTIGSPRYLRGIADRLEELLPKLPDNGFRWDYDQQEGDKLVAACREAAERGVPLDFC